MFNPDVIAKIRAEEIAVVVCMRGTQPELPGMKVGLGECCSCQVVIHYELSNKPVIDRRGLQPICLRCFVDGGLMTEMTGLPEALVGGQELEFGDGWKAVNEMVKPTKESN